jgi:hypothetical protein
VVFMLRGSSTAGALASGHMPRRVPSRADWLSRHVALAQVSSAWSDGEEGLPSTRGSTVEHAVALDAARPP